ncbi:MAG TPA: protein translocase subunit SecF [Gemmatimonadales bacterium]|nr:protein translocase subunit SecF [Gemmatimonadales bacterium]
MRFFANANFDFLAFRRTAYLATAAFIAAGLVISIIRSFNWSIEFTGGTLIQVEAQAPIEVGGVRSALAERGITGAEIQSFGSDREMVIRARVIAEGVDVNDTQATAAAVVPALDQAIGAGQYTLVRTEAVSPKVGDELRGRAVLAILLSFLAVLAYLAVRFEWRFGLAAVVATAHDVIATILFIGILRLEISLFVVAGVLSVLGYSLNDTIVIFDRIRENLNTARRANFLTILNRSINETLPRTVLTGGTSIGTLLALAFLGGEVIRPFALVMLFGIVIGTFSSIFIATPVLLEIENKWPGADAKGVPVVKRKTQPAT